MGETCVPNTPKRIIAISQFTLGNLLALNVKPIASASALSDSETDFPAYFGKVVNGIKQLGSQYEPNLERLLLSKPDLILGWDAVNRSYPLLSQISPTALDTWQGMPSWREHFDFIAKVLGKEEVERQAWIHYSQRIKELRLALKNRFMSKTISVVFINDELGYRVLAKNSFIGSILDDLDLKRPDAQNATTPNGWIFSTSQEKLEEIDGDILFVLTLKSNDTHLLEKVLQKALWQKLKAVRTQQVYNVNALTWVGSNLIAANVVIDDLYNHLVNSP
ncbi:MAG: iron-siderophore ABC transporter substrate-binding protein [Leptolyngbyaceae cyanobacterium SU_3_3]|nr:iron-siderophore ABC transporter substrate-binding protein [Leptolyngbyaceae cyanobacterium SU_3_3]